ncbi:MULTISPECIES: ABC transporter substrate-binding protein [Bosea]|uniref:ABC transporter substrate-binding protein n=1 Tax=Bosea TaxID=85413 RepID=UPI00214FDC3A|nr:MULTISPECIES: ABC transporter substrate-binding protein [Bosea]MCR4520731.1 ABC transporter substrate-binding protein [Bosea sp. 47.2.35]MDR6828327.1 branched-chain amino acid transport system substrate-binding protein [Bosea robiniae]MDR6894986.1 branched-chain amino acid transport system substrate-binding protein [Bosea sp. BE109]MDR7138448.1 branched-chain amino acid transport system substrate-binding protein [Bosea sp. BE168]MDR7175147.1 branched-chain amino acid transport system substr
MTEFTTDRRTLLAGAAALASLSALPGRALAQGAPIRIGTLTPLTGAGGPYGPVMVKAVKAVIDEVNAAGGVLGRKVELISEDDQTNPEAGVRAARKLIDVDKVSAILGTWASSVTTAVAPLCWESKTFLATVSGADSITQLPHQGYLIRTQPNTTLQGRKFGEFCTAEKAKRVFFLSPQTPFAKSQFDNITEAVKKAGGETGSLIYDDKKPAYRSEIDEVLRFKPDAIIFGGYTPDTAVMLKDAYRAGYGGLKVAFGYAVNQKLVESVPAEVVDKTFTIAPSPAEGSKAYARLVKMIGVASPDPYTTQVYDQINLILMAIAMAGDTSGTAIKEAVRKVSQAQGGAKVDNALDGLKAIAAKQPVDYDGASGPCDFTETGDIADCQFRYEQVQGGKLALVKIA